MCLGDHPIFLRGGLAWLRATLANKFNRCMRRCLADMAPAVLAGRVLCLIVKAFVSESHSAVALTQVETLDQHSKRAGLESLYFFCNWRLGVLNQEIVSFRFCVRTHGLFA